MAELSEGPVCPVPLAHTDRIILGHGSGGLLSHQLIQKVFFKHFNNNFLSEGDDSARITMPAGLQIAVTTDSHIVTPLFFPGGDIGKLAVCGTLNDLVMVGAIPKYLTAGFILEEGLDIEILDRVVASMASAALEANVKIIAGDTKVVEKGKADGIFINTSGIGYIPEHRQRISGCNAEDGDVIILSGTLADHGIAVLSARNQLDFEVDACSDVAALNHLADEILIPGHGIHVMRDPTRGGLGTTLNEIAGQSKKSIHLIANQIPVKENINSVCEMLGFDPLYVANEGKMVIIVEKEKANQMLQTIKQNPLGKDAAIIGFVLSADPGLVIIHTEYGSTRIVPMLTGEMLPRIC